MVARDNLLETSSKKKLLPEELISISAMTAVEEYYQRTLSI